MTFYLTECSVAVRKDEQEIFGVRKMCPTMWRIIEEWDSQLECSDVSIVTQCHDNDKVWLEYSLTDTLITVIVLLWLLVIQYVTRSDFNMRSAAHTTIEHGHL